MGDGRGEAFTLHMLVYNSEAQKWPFLARMGVSLYNKCGTSISLEAHQWPIPRQYRA
jgi:hypothetical protein